LTLSSLFEGLRFFNHSKTTFFSSLSLEV
jgi:hypothetical protein